MTAIISYKNKKFLCHLTIEKFNNNGSFLNSSFSEIICPTFSPEKALEKIRKSLDARFYPSYINFYYEKIKNTQDHLTFNGKGRKLSHSGRLLRTHYHINILIKNTSTK